MLDTIALRTVGIIAINLTFWESSSIMEWAEQACDIFYKDKDQLSWLPPLEIYLQVTIANMIWGTIYRLIIYFYWKDNSDKSI